MFGMFIALAALKMTNNACATYRAGENELTIGRTEAFKGKHASAYRRYTKALKLIDRTYDESTAELVRSVHLRDDTIFGLTLSRDDYRNGRFRQAAEGAGEVLKERLQNIAQANSCKR